MQRLALLATAMLGAACASAPRTTPARADAVFVDEFDGPTIDRATWEVYTGRVYNDEQQRYVDDTATMRIVRGAEAEGASGGALLIQALRRPQGATPAAGDFVSGRLHARATFRYGTVSARMKLPPGAGLWPAFWILGVGDWPAHGEIDVMETVGDPTWTNAALHGPGYSGDTPFVRRDTFPAGTDVSRWHVYTAVWTPDDIAFQVDGREFYRVTRAEVLRYGAPAVLDTPKYVIFNLAIGGGYPRNVNGVTAPYLGLPQATVDAIDAGRARVLVDWVRWTR